MNLGFYTIDSSYCDYLRQFDSKVPYNFDEKKSRPFIGIVLNIGSIKFFAPLSSPKEKHKHMKNTVDFTKIDGGRKGAINFNNMIPVPDKAIHPIIFANEVNEKYRFLLESQYAWCVAHSKSISVKASELFSLFVANKLSNKVKARCCDFVGDIQYVNQWK